MNEQKSFLMYVAEMVKQYRADRRRNSSQEAQPQPNRLRRFLRWLTPNGGTLLLVAALIASAQVWAKPLASPATPGPSATTFNYQARLADSGGTSLDGIYGMSFSLWDAATDGNLVWGPESHAAVPVSEGLFSVGLGSQTSGGIPTSVWNGDRYLEITVGGETLSPRELIRSVPIAGMALTAATALTVDAILDEASKPVLIQAGRVQNTSVTSPQYIYITFDQPFKTGTIPRVIVSPNSGSADWPLGWYVVLPNHSGFRIYRQSEFPKSWDWIAIGEPE
jgi:hypothetical protein